MYDEAATARRGPPKAESAATLHIAAKESTFDIANNGIGIVVNKCVVAASQLEDCSVAKADADASITLLQLPSCDATTAHSFMSFQCRCLQNVDTFVAMQRCNATLIHVGSDAIACSIKQRNAVTEFLRCIASGEKKVDGALPMPPLQADCFLFICHDKSTSNGPARRNVDT